MFLSSIRNLFVLTGALCKERNIKYNDFFSPLQRSDVFLE